MIETFVDIPTPDGQMPSFVVHPEEGGPHPVVLFFMDAPGMREELRQMARRLASAGYWVVASQLYYRDVREYCLFETDLGPDAIAQMFSLMSSLTPDRVRTDADAMLAFAADHEAADATRVGAVGYCMSGHFTIRVAADHPDTVHAAASFHGVALVTDAEDSPHRLLPQLSAEVYIGAAETDEYAPPEMIAAFDAAMDEHGTPGRVETYPGTHHGFVFPERGEGLYDLAAAERHWEVVHDLFRRRLQQR